jgi:hypothetical protein
MDSWEPLFDKAMLAIDSLPSHLPRLEWTIGGNMKAPVSRNAGGTHANFCSYVGVAASGVADLPAGELYYLAVRQVIGQHQVVRTNWAQPSRTFSQARISLPY